VVHRQGRGEPRVLYWFRTPPHVKVGRSAFDPETIRLLEAQHPDIAFDWNRMLEEPPQPLPPEQDRRREAREAREARQARRRRIEGRLEQDETPEAPERPGDPEGPEVLADPEAEQEAELAEAFDRAREAALEEPAREVDGEAIPPFGASDLSGPEPEDTHPLLVLLGSEGLMRLRARHAALLARIAEASDEARRDAWRADAALIDPDGWLTAEEARAGLESYEARYEALRSALGVRRKRRRRRGRRPAPPSAVELGSAATAGPGGPDEPENSREP
jgi:hypothetical protein